MHTLTADKAKRVRIPDAKPGQVFAYELGAKGIILTPVVKESSVPAKARLVKGPKGYLVVQTDRVITQEEVRRAQDEFP